MSPPTDAKATAAHPHEGLGVGVPPDPVTHLPESALPVTLFLMLFHSVSLLYLCCFQVINLSEVIGTVWVGFNSPAGCPF